MSLPKKATFKCSKCGASMQMTVFESVNSAYAEDVAMRIMSGKLFEAECPHCHFVNHVEYDFLYHDLEHGAMIWVVHKNSSDYEEKIKEIRDSFKPQYKVLRVVNDVNALKEKVSCLENNRDDRIVELCKLFATGNLISQQPNFAFRNVFYSALTGREVVYIYDTNGEEMCWEMTEEAYGFLSDLYYSSNYATQFDGDFPVIDQEWAEGMLHSLMQAEKRENDSVATPEKVERVNCDVVCANYVCPRCNNENPERSVYCAYCGLRLRGDGSSSAPSSALSGCEQGGKGMDSDKKQKPAQYRSKKSYLFTIILSVTIIILLGILIAVSMRPSGVDDVPKQPYYKVLGLTYEQYKLASIVSYDEDAYCEYMSVLIDMVEKSTYREELQKEKVAEYLNNQTPLDYGQKIIMFRLLFPSDDEYCYDICEYLDSREDISYKDAMFVLEQLGFAVFDDGTVKW